MKLRGLPIPFVGSGEAYDMPINPATALGSFMSVVGIAAIPGLGAVLGLVFSQLLAKDYHKEIDIFNNATKPMFAGLQNKDFISATAPIRANDWRQEPQHTRVVFMIRGWGPDQIAQLRPKVESAMFTAMLGYGLQTEDWNALKVFNQQLQDIDNYTAPGPENFVMVEGFADPVPIEVSPDQEGSIRAPEWITLDGQTYHWDEGDEYGRPAQYVRADMETNDAGD